jgi:hypothetical protein
LTVVVAVNAMILVGAAGFTEVIEVGKDDAAFTAAGIELASWVFEVDVGVSSPRGKKPT